MRIGVVTLGLMLAFGLSGCASEQASIASSMTQPIEDATAAVNTVRLALKLESQDRATSPVTETSIDDMRTSAIDAVNEVSSEEADGNDAAALRTDVLAVLRDSVDAIETARAGMAGNDSAKSAAPAELKSVASNLRELEQLVNDLAGGSK